MSNKERGQEALKHLERELNSRDRKQNSKPWSIAALSAVVIVALGGGIYFLANQDGDSTNEAQSSAEETTAPSEFDANNYEAIATKRAEALPASVSCEYTPDAAQGDKKADLPKTDNVSTTGTVNVELDTSAGPIGMELDRSVSPCTVNAIEHLASAGYFNDTVCHRLTDGDGLKVLQCGDPTGVGSGGPGFQFANEFPTDEALKALKDAPAPDGVSPEEAEQMKQMELQQNPQKYARGTIAMANAGLDTNGSQFFLNYGDSVLPPLYTYFGQISEEGLNTLDKIAEKGVEGGGRDGAPAEEVRIKSATVK